MSENDYVIYFSDALETKKNLPAKYSPQKTTHYHYTHLIRTFTTQRHHPLPSPLSQLTLLGRHLVHHVGLHGADAAAEHDGLHPLPATS